MLTNNGTIHPDKKITYDWDYDYGSSKPHAATHIGDRTFLYDLNGNQAGWDADRTGQKRRIVWDEENRIQTITDGPTSEYKYDEDTTRVIKRRPQGETFYINPWYVDAAGRNSKHVFAGSTRISTKLQMPGGTGTGGPGNVEKFQYFYHPDHLGSTSYVTNELGEVDQHYETFPFGESWIEEATGQADKVTPYRFTGKEWDQETQLYYFGARYYDPRTSLWQSMDPVLGSYLNATKTGFKVPSLPNSWQASVTGPGTGGAFQPKNLSLAGYAHQNPVKITDPTGNVIETVWDAGNALYGAYSTYDNIKQGNYGWAAVDAVGTVVDGAATIVPFIPGGVSAGIKAYRTGGSFWDAFKAGNKGSDAASAGNKAGDAARTGCSFDASTPVATKDGLKRIDQLLVNELVLAKNEETGETGYRQITDIFVNTHAETVRLTLRPQGSDESEVVYSATIWMRAARQSG